MKFLTQFLKLTKPKKKTGTNPVFRGDKGNRTPDLLTASQTL
jgi:hypothetical protein